MQYIFYTQEWSTPFKKTTKPLRITTIYGIPQSTGARREFPIVTSSELKV